MKQKSKIDLITERAQLVLEMQDIRQQLRDFPQRNEWYHRTDSALRHKQRQYHQIEIELARRKEEEKDGHNAAFRALLAVARAADQLAHTSDDLAEALDVLDIVLPTWKEKHDHLRGS